MSEDKFGQPADYLVGKSFVENISYNVAQQVIITSADKLYRPLAEWKHSLESRSSWPGNVALFLALLLTDVTTETKATFGLAKEIWSALLLLLTVAAFVWMVRGFIQNWKKCLSIDDVVNQIRNSPPPAESPVPSTAGKQ